MCSAAGARNGRVLWEQIQQQHVLPWLRPVADLCWKFTWKLRNNALLLLQKLRAAWRWD